MAKSSFRIIAVRPITPLGRDDETIAKVKSIQKKAFGNDWMYFYGGYHLTDVPNGVADEYAIQPLYGHFLEVPKDADSDRMLFDSDSISVNISAVVGPNGSGKSSTIELMIRILNNLSVAAKGETYNHKSSEHLFFIEDVYGSIVAVEKDMYFQIQVFGRSVKIANYQWDEDNKSLVCGQLLELLDTDGQYNRFIPINGSGLGKLQLYNLFYTAIFNYSMYAFNYKDYYEERTLEDRWRKRKKGDNVQLLYEGEYNQDRNWLKGLFHKNDGYQTPVVIHPMRNKGYVNAAQVNYLGKQNLISLAFEENAHPERGGGKFPFRIINQTHHLVAFYFCPPAPNGYDGFIDGIMKMKFDLTDEQKKRFSEAEKPIKAFWASAMGVTKGNNPMSRQEKRAWDYVAYKTIKIFWNYKHYEEAWNNLDGDFDKKLFAEHLKTLLKDSTHRTLKLRQTLAYLKFHNEKDYYMNKNVVVDLDDIYAWMSKKVGKQLYPGKDYHPIEVDDLLPPPYPITDIVLQLVDNEHLEEYKEIKNRSLNIIPFAGLSAGERQIAYTLGNIVYHLKNIESAKKDFNIDPNHLESLKYDFVNIMLDEVELYFHPDLQRRFVNLLIDAIKGLNLDSTSGINVTLITHSPFVLSDIPSENIMFLSRNKEDVLEGNTFAANIHDLFNNTFFLPYTVGELARKEISDIVGLYNVWRTNKSRMVRTGSDNKEWSFSEQELGEVTKRKWAKMKYIASVVGDDYLQSELTDMLEEMESFIERGWDNEEN